MNLIKSGFFEEATVIASGKILGDAIFTIAGEENITALAFAYYLLLQNDTRDNHGTIEGLLLSHFCYLGCAEHAVYSHGLRCLEENPGDLDLLKSQLWLYRSPDNDIDPAEFRAIAKQVLLKDPNNKQAQEILSQTSTLEGVTPLPLGKKLPINEKIQVLIEGGRFPEAEKLGSAISREDLINILQNIAHKKNICAYDFLWMLLTKEESVDLHQLAAEMLAADFAISPFGNPIKGADAVKGFHERRARELGTHSPPPKNT